MTEKGKGGSWLLGEEGSREVGSEKLEGRGKKQEDRGEKEKWEVKSKKLEVGG